VKNIRDVVGQELKWVQPSTFKAAYVLEAGGEPAATLRFRSGLGSFATTESADGCWTFKRMGFLQTTVPIRACGSDEDLAVFRNATWKRGGTLEFPDGRKYPANINFWMTAYEFTTDAGVALVNYRSIGGLAHLSSMVTISPTGASLTELPWLVALGWYLVVMVRRDSAAVAVV
jgi:hypothetical protein